MTTLNIIYKDVESLIPYENNSRTHSEFQIKQIIESIQEFGFTNPILLDGENGVIAGHGRLQAAKELGIEQVPTIELSHLTPEQKSAYVIADNKLALNAGWDRDLLVFEMQKLQDAGYNLGLTGFNDAEISQFFIDDDHPVDHNEEWKGMPEYNNTDQTPYRTILVHFESEVFVKEFERVMKQSLTEKTKFIWFPEKQRLDMSSISYKNEA
jgi:ParB-like nuclease domain